MDKNYIERKKVFEIIDGAMIPNLFTKEFLKARVRIEPAADVVEAVRCKDCKHYYENDAICLKIYSDGNVSANAWQERKPDDFCSYGEKRVNNDT